MTTTSRPNTRRMYSWWWDSHISPKNSKWLQENLTDMDTKVKQMIKLLEEDADTFARKAEMYYKKRPELMKLVEDFYRAYRALAERYDNATGVLRQAHRTMAEAFPNQVPFDDSPAGLGNEGDPRTPEMPPHIRALFDSDELQKDGLGLSPQSNSGRRNGAFTEEPNSVTSRRGLKHFNDFSGSGEGRAKKGLNFEDIEENERNGGNNLKVSATEAEISALKEALAKLEAEKEAGLLQYQQSLDKLSNLESEVSRAQEDSTRLNDRASKAETEAQNLREALSKLESEQEASLLKYQQCLDKVSLLESDIIDVQRSAEEFTEIASKAENEAENLRQGLAEVEAEKEAALVQYRESLERIVKLEEKLLHAEESSSRYNELADKAESELIILKQAVEKLTEEKEAAAIQYLQCLEKISSLEYRLSCAEEEAERLHREIDDGILKLRSAEEKCLLLETSNVALQSELESLVLKMGSQNQELTENQKEQGRLWNCVQDEHLRFVEAETAFQTLQDLHSQTEEELRSLAAELQNRTHILKGLEIQNQSLVAEVQETKNENRNLDELNVSIKKLQDELSSLREKLSNLEAEVEHRTNERNALQQEIYCLKEEINDLNKKNGAVFEQVESTGYNLDCFGTSVKKLQDEYSRMKATCETEKNEKAALLQKLIILEQLVEKNAFLENSISDMSVDLEETKERVKILEESCQSLLGEKSTLSSEKVALTSLLRVTTKNLEELSEKNTLLENSLSDAVAELEALRVNSKDLEVSCQLLDQQKSGLITERESLLYQLDTSHNTLEDLDIRYRESVDKHSVLANERESAFCEIEKLKAHFDAEKQAHSSFTEISEKRLAGMELQMRSLQEECDHWKKEYEGETDKAINSQLVIFVLQNCMQDMKDNNLSSLLESQKLLKESERSKEAISKLELENHKRQEQIKSFIEKNKILRTGLQQVSRTLFMHHGFDHETEQDQTLLNHIFSKLEEKQNSINEISDEYYQLVIEKSITEKFLAQMKNVTANVLMERDALDQEHRIQSQQILILQSGIVELSEELKLKVMDGNRKEQVLKTEMENVCRNLHNVEEAYQLLQVENFKALDEKTFLTKEVLDLGKQRSQLEEENSDMLNETIFQSQLFLICKDIISEILEEMRKLAECRDKLQFRNNDLGERVKELERKLGHEKTMNLELTMFLEKSRSEAKNYLTEKNILDHEHRNQSERYLILQAEMEKLLELNEEMKLKIVKGSHKEEALTTERENVCKKLQDLEGAYQSLHDESCKANEEKIFLSKEISELRKDKQELEEENINMFTERVFQSELSFIYKDVVSENLAELRKLAECMDKLHFRNNELEERVKMAYQSLYDESCKANEEKISLSKEISELRKEKQELEEENINMFTERIFQSELSCIFKDVVSENLAELRKFAECMDELHFRNNELEERVKRAYLSLYDESCKANEEKTFLSMEISKLRKDKQELEEVNIKMFTEGIFQSELSFIYKDVVSENLAELRKLAECMNELRFRNNELEVRVKRAYQSLLDESCKANEKKLSLSKKISELRKDKQELEEVNINMFTERIFQSELSFIYKDVVSENLAELRKLAKCMDELRCRNNELEDRVKVMLAKLGDGQTKNTELMNSLEKSQNEAENYLMERKMLDQELRNQSELNSTLQDKMEKHLKLNADMSLKLIESNRREELLTTEKENVCKKLEILEGTYQILHAESCKAIEEEKSLTNEILGLRKEKHELEDVSIDMFGETIFQSQLSFIYKDIVSENLHELRKLVECMDKLQSTNKDLEESVKIMEGKLGDEQTKNSELTMSLALSAGVIEEVGTLLSLKQSERMELLQAVKELEEINEEQKKQMDKISSDKDCLAKETEFLREENRKMDLELKGVRNEVERSIISEESLISELQMKNNEVQSWESQAATFFCELQISVIHQSIFEEKIHELTEACKFVKDRNTSKDVEIELLKDKIVSSEGENGRMKTQLAAYAPAIQTLKDSISSLEKHAIPKTKKPKVEEQEVKESDSATSQHPESFQQPHDDYQVHHDGSVELQDLNRRIQVIEVAFEEFDALDKFNVNAKLGKARKEIQVVKSGQESGRLTKDKSALRGHERYNRSHSKSEISEAGSEVLTKDILLDRVSDNSSYENSQRETTAAGDRMLQMWESTDQNGCYIRAAGKAPMLASSSIEYHQVGSTRRRGSKHPSNESLVEKELDVDKLEISQRISELPQEGNKRRILERLDSDAQKLANLQITIQDLKKKMDVTEKSKTKKGAEYDTAKEQVKEAEETITKLYEMNLKLTKNAQDSFLAADEASTLGPEENDSVQSKRISEQARRGSEKIGRLQLELKKLHFLIMKLDGEREARGKSKASERSPRVLLRDFLYGRTRTKKKQKKKSPFCSCMRPSTRGD